MLWFSSLSSPTFSRTPSTTQICRRPRQHPTGLPLRRRSANDGGDGGQAGSRQNPFPIGQTVSNEDWDVTLGAPREAWTEVRSENEFNDPPGSGMEFWIVPVTATYKGDDTGNTGSIFGLISSARITGPTTTTAESSRTHWQTSASCIRAERLQGTCGSRTGRRRRTMECDYGFHCRSRLLRVQIEDSAPPPEG